MGYLQTLKSFSFSIILVSCASKAPLSRSTSIITPIKGIDRYVENQMVTFKEGDLKLGPRVHLDESPLGVNFKFKGVRAQRSEVSQYLWVSIMGDNPSFHKTVYDCNDHSSINGVELCPNNPVESIKYDEIIAFLSRLNKLTEGHYRLPTELEWEFVNQETLLHKAKIGEFQAKEFALFKNEVKRTAPVRSKKPLSNGLYMTGGNVWEITETVYNKFEYYGIPDEALKGHKVIKGGGWNSRYDHLRSSYRGKWPIDLRSNDIGFRLFSN